jgi:hypothetical protein
VTPFVIAPHSDIEHVLRYRDRLFTETAALAEWARDHRAELGTDYRVDVQHVAMRYLLLDSTLWYPSEDATVVVEASAALVDQASFRIFPTDLPEPSGFVLNPVNPLYDEREIPILIGWQALRLGDAIEDAGPVSNPLDANVVAFHVVLASRIFPGETGGKSIVYNRLAMRRDGLLGAGRDDIVSARVPMTGPHFVQLVAFGMPIDEQNIVPAWRSRIIELLAMWRLSWQGLLEHVPPVLDRAARRRLARKRIEPTRGVKFVTIRRSSGRGDGGSPGRSLSYRTVTRGHWRRHHFRSLGPARCDDGTWNEDSHRLVWIDPYVRGPDDAPLAERVAVTILPSST